MTRPRVVVAGATLLFLACCSLPWVGLWDPNGIADTGLYGLYGSRMAHGLVPYRDYFMEFPPGALPALVLPALPGSHYVVWFKIFEALCGAGTIACLGAILVRLRATTRESGVALALAATAPAVLGPIALNSFDYWPALLTTAAVAALIAGRRKTGFALLGIATAAKLFPAGLLPLALLYVFRHHGRDTWRSSIGAYAGAIAVVFLPFAILGPGGLRYSLRAQLTRGLQLESLGASLLAAAHHLGAYAVTYTPNLAYAQMAGPFASAVATLSTIAMLAAIALVAWLYRRTDGNADALVLAAGATVCAIVAFAKALSPQYLLWLVALAAAASVYRTLAVPLLIAILGLTQIWVPDRFRELQALGWVTWVLLARNLLLVALFAVLATALRAAGAGGAIAAAGRPRRRARHEGRRARSAHRDRTA